MSSELALELSALLGAQAVALRRLAGGEINDAYVATLADGRAVFLKTRSAAPSGMYAREAEGLRFLAEPASLRLPEVLAVSDSLLALEYIAPAAKRADYDELLGRGLALLHRAAAPCHGLERDNFIGYLPQPNAPLPSWSAFYRERRLEPLVRRGRDCGLLDPRLATRFEQLLSRLEQWLGPEEPPSRLHGDLWSGNLHVDEAGRPVLVDPAVYGGQREVDLAMLQLFGTPSTRFHGAYDEAYPRAAGHAQRVSLYQLYPLLVHVHLFGTSYLPQLSHALGAYV